jgi:hypothetical protein
VVVHARSEVEGSSTRGNATVTTGGASESVHGYGRLESGVWLTGRISGIPVVLPGLEVTERRRAARGIRHDPQAPVDLVLLPQLAKHPPHRLHESRLEGLVTRLKVDPPTHALDRVLPLASVTHHDLSARGVVLVDTEGHDVGFALDVEGFVNLVLDGKTVRVPSETTLDMVARRVGMAGDNVLARVSGCAETKNRSSKALEVVPSSSLHFASTQASGSWGLRSCPPNPP